MDKAKHFDKSHQRIEFGNVLLESSVMAFYFGRLGS